MYVSSMHIQNIPSIQPIQIQFILLVGQAVKKGLDNYFTLWMGDFEGQCLLGGQCMCIYIYQFKLRVYMYIHRHLKYVQVVGESIRQYHKPLFGALSLSYTYNTQVEIIWVGLKIGYFQIALFTISFYLLTYTSGPIPYPIHA